MSIKKIGDSKRENMFHWRCLKNNKVCFLIIDGRSCTNVASRRLVNKLNLPTTPHLRPYKLEDGEIKVTNHVFLIFFHWQIQGWSVMWCCYHGDMPCTIGNAMAIWLTCIPWWPHQQVLILKEGKEIFTYSSTCKEVRKDQLVTMLQTVGVFWR